MNKEDLICEQFKTFEERLKEAESFDAICHCCEEITTLHAFLISFLEIEGDRELIELVEEKKTAINRLIESLMNNFTIQEMLATVMTYNEPKAKVQMSYRDVLMDFLGSK